MYTKHNHMQHNNFIHTLFKRMEVRMGMLRNKLRRMMSGGCSGMELRGEDEFTVISVIY